MRYLPDAVALTYIYLHTYIYMYRDEMKSDEIRFHDVPRVGQVSWERRKFRNEVPEARKDGSELRKIAFAEATEAVAWLRVICG